jgi:hypothetical protein
MNEIPMDNVDLWQHVVTTIIFRRSDMHFIIIAQHH